MGAAGSVRRGRIRQSAQAFCRRKGDVGVCERNTWIRTAMPKPASRFPTLSGVGGVFRCSKGRMRGHRMLPARQCWSGTSPAAKHSIIFAPPSLCQGDPNQQFLSHSRRNGRESSGKNRFPDKNRRPKQARLLRSAIFQAARQAKGTGTGGTPARRRRLKRSHRLLACSSTTTILQEGVYLQVLLYTRNLEARNKARYGLSGLIEERGRIPKGCAPPPQLSNRRLSRIMRHRKFGRRVRAAATTARGRPCPP